jgi:hypothetical protein
VPDGSFGIKVVSPSWCFPQIHSEKEQFRGKVGVSKNGLDFSTATTPNLRGLTKQRHISHSHGKAIARGQGLVGRGSSWYSETQADDSKTIAVGREGGSDAHM